MGINDDTIAIRAGENFDSAQVETYTRKHIPNLGPETLEVRQFPAGASNLTYLLRIGTWEGVLRRPPLGPVPPKAHDMEREAGLLAKIHPVFPLAPRPYVFCNDLTILGAPFYIMERRKGLVLNATFPTHVEASPELCQKLTSAVVDTLVHIHAIDWQQADLSHFGRPEGFLARQVKGWIERYKRAQTDDIAGLDMLLNWLVAHIPTNSQATLIHNDFKLNNMLLRNEDITQVEAVLDWEMATIGDPLFDLAVALSYWVTHDDPEDLQTVLPVVTTQPGFPDRAAFMERYARKSGRDLSSMHFYMTFAYFKLAVIIQQIYVRWRRGQTQDERFATFGTHVHHLITHAAHTAQKGQV